MQGAGILFMDTARNKLIDLNIISAQTQMENFAINDTLILLSLYYRVLLYHHYP
jgi:hypothetical protein